MSKQASKVPLLHLSEVSDEEGERIFYSGRLEDLPPSFTEYDSSHRHSYFAVFYFVEGKGTHKIDFQNFEIEKNSLFFLKPGQVHSWKFKKKPKGFALKIHPEFYSKLNEKNTSLRSFPYFGFDSGLSKIHPEKFSKLRSDFSRLVEEFKENADPKILFYISGLILLQIQKEYETSAALLIRKNRPVSEFQSLLEKYFIKERGTSFYARRLGLASNTLNRICQNSLGISAKSVIHDRLLLECKRLLLHSDLNITQISSELGFTDNAYFSRYFKKQSGVSPEQFRESGRKVQ
ncbi:helix-turn-helix domain-containing protein [Leptospira sarikeiensis]|uniref:Helix-turn-helix domain-containing protein n=1 Tax=Leptospira sarikeiensis TaxID=2484943 RepID=A0A4R9JYQ2_9LEPT|nr:helix-turn-helix domain-containing protein [Leptospira sarikeiensis]TGL58397.1 helix-turn-helix domain-containing protein [Leptospira sarikeiensis]